MGCHETEPLHEKKERGEKFWGSQSPIYLPLRSLELACQRLSLSKVLFIRLTIREKRQLQTRARESERENDVWWEQTREVYSKSVSMVNLSLFNMNGWGDHWSSFDWDKFKISMTFEVLIWLLNEGEVFAFKELVWDLNWTLEFFYWSQMNYS